MNGNGFQLAVPHPGSGGKFPPIIEKALATGYSEAGGALLTVNGSDQYAACGANPNSVAAVALTPGGTDTSGFNILGHKEFPPGFMQGIALRGEKFNAPYVGTMPTIANGQYGVIRDTDGVWKVDFNNLDNPVVTHLATPDFNPGIAVTGEPYALVQFLDAVIQPIGY